MSAAPQWSPTDESTADLLTLVRDEGHVSADFEWDEFVRCLRFVAANGDGETIHPNALRPLLRGSVAPRRIGAFTNSALSRGLVEYTGDWQISDDTKGHNAGKPARVLRWIGGES